MRIENSYLYLKKKVWANKFDNFTIEVVRITNTDDLYNWFYYVYIFKAHPIFDKIENNSLFNSIPDDCNDMFHCGISYNNWYYNEKGKIIYKKLGCDYLHAIDDRENGVDTQKYAEEVFYDAKELANFLKEYENENNKQ